MCQGTGQLFCKVESVPEATSHPPVHALLRAHPPTPLPLWGSRRSRCRNHKVEMRIWWNKQPRTKKRGGMEVEGAGLQGRGLKVAGREGGSEHVSRSWGGPWPLLPPLRGGDCGWQSLASECPRLPRTPTCPCPGLHRDPTAGQDGGTPTAQPVGGTLRLVQQLRDYPQPQPGHSRKGTLLHVPPTSPKDLNPPPRPRLLPPPHREQAAYRSEPPFLIQAWRRQRKPRRRGGDGCGGWKEMAPARCPPPHASPRATYTWSESARPRYRLKALP